LQRCFAYGAEGTDAVNIGPATKSGRSAVNRAPYALAAVFQMTIAEPLDWKGATNGNHAIER
jgi:hypothetical protein